MKITAIVAEYNPLTNGHLAHIRAAKEETGADTLVAVMSGSFSQRGDACVADKYLRASTAVRLGVDMVVELPTVFAISSADNFALGALRTLSVFPDLKCLSFGSECGDAALLTKVAELLADEPAELSAAIKEKLKEGMSYPRARAEAFDLYIDSHPKLAACKGVLDAPNNVLGVSYITAIKKLGLKIEVHTVKRIGGDYNSTDIKTDLPSASAVREALFKGNMADVKRAVPSFMYNVLAQYRPNPSSLGDLILFKIKGMSGHDLEGYHEVTGGLHNRIKLAAVDAHTYDELLEAVKSKAYTMARIKRICLYALFDITKAEYERALAAPPYVFVLALNQERKDLLSALSAATPNVLVRYSDISRVDRSLRFLIKLDFTAQGTLGIVHKSGYYNKKMLLV